jgi:hypothetical protein
MKKLCDLVDEPVTKLLLLNQDGDIRITLKLMLLESSLEAVKVTGSDLTTQLFFSEAEIWGSE